MTLEDPFDHCAFSEQKGDPCLSFLEFLKRQPPAHILGVIPQENKLSNAGIGSKR